jgi:hypothetical protein
LKKPKEHAQRLETILDEVIREEIDDGVKDAALITAAQRVEHYEMAGYGCVRTYANLLGDSEAGNPLERTLQEEKEAGQLLGGIAEQINVAIPLGQTRNAKRSTPYAERCRSDGGTAIAFLDYRISLIAIERVAVYAVSKWKKQLYSLKRRHLWSIGR